MRKNDQRGKRTDVYGIWLIMCILLGSTAYAGQTVSFGGKTYMISSDAQSFLSGVQYVDELQRNGYFDPESKEMLPCDEALFKQVSEDLFLRTSLVILNGYRAACGKSELKLDSVLTDVAMQRAQEITEKFGHTRPDGTKLKNLVNTKKSGVKRLAENIAMGQSTPQEVMNAWAQSEGHNKNMLGESYKNVGIGISRKDDQYYWVLVFSD